MGQVGLGEEGGGVPVIDGSPTGQDFAQVGGEDRGIELPLPNVRMGGDDLPPGFERTHGLFPVSHLSAIIGPAAARSSRTFWSSSLRGPCKKCPIDTALSRPSGRRMWSTNTGSSKVRDSVRWR